MENEKTQDSLVSLPPQWQAWWQWQAQEGVWVLTKPYTNHSQPTQPKYNLTSIQKKYSRPQIQQEKAKYLFVFVKVIFPSVLIFTLFPLFGNLFLINGQGLLA